MNNNNSFDDSFDVNRRWSYDTLDVSSSISYMSCLRPWLCLLRRSRQKRGGRPKKVFSDFKMKFAIVWHSKLRTARRDCSVRLTQRYK